MTLFRDIILFRIHRTIGIALFMLEETSAARKRRLGREAAARYRAKLRARRPPKRVGMSAVERQRNRRAKVVKPPKRWHPPVDHVAQRWHEHLSAQLGRELAEALEQGDTLLTSAVEHLLDNPMEAFRLSQPLVFQGLRTACACRDRGSPRVEGNPTLPWANKSFEL
jgi:hypothetical protein